MNSFFVVDGGDLVWSCFGWFVGVVVSVVFCELIFVSLFYLRVNDVF